MRNDERDRVDLHQVVNNDENGNAVENSSGGPGSRISSTFGERYPWLTQLGQQPVDALSFQQDGNFPKRLLTILHRGGIFTCADLAATDERDILDVRHAGAGTLGLLIQTLELAAAHFLDVGQFDKSSATWMVSPRHKAASDVIRTAVAAGDSLAGIRESLGVLADWATFCGAESTIGDVLDAVDREDLPADVSAAAAAVRRHPFPLAPSAPRSALKEWLASLGPREREIVRHRISWQDRTLDDLGNSHAVSRERIRQLERQLRTEFSHALSRDDWKEVRWAVDHLKSEAGSWARVAALPNAHPDDEEWRLVLSLADLALDPKDLTVLRRGVSLPKPDDLRFIEPDRVLLDECHAGRLLSDHGVREIHHDDALSSLGLLKIDGRWIRWPRSVVERAVALLALHQEPMTADELTDLTGSSSVRSTRQRLQDDSRVQRVTRDTLGLRSWGLPEYTGVADLMLKVIAERGGSMPLDDLISHLETIYQIKPGTAMAYTGAPAFVTDNGTIRARGRSEPYPVNTDPSRVRGLSLSPDGRTILDVDVDGELLRGSGRPAPTALAGLLGLQPGRTLEYATKQEEQPSVVVTWPRTSHVGPTLGSLRALALLLGGEKGDRLRLIFDPVSLTVEADVMTRVDQSSP